MVDARGLRKVRAALQGTDSRFFREFNGYAIPIEQSNRVLGIGHKDIIHHGPGTVGYK